MRIQQTPSRCYQREFNKHHSRITVEDSTKAVQVLPMRIQQELSSHYQWISNNNCPVITYHWRFCKPGITSEDSTKVARVITSKCSTKAAQVLPVKVPWKLSKCHQWIFNDSCPGIINADSTEVVQVQPANTLGNLSSYWQWWVSEEKKFALCREKNEMKFARLWNWILYETTLGREINEWDK